MSADKTYVKLQLHARRASHYAMARSEQVGESLAVEVADAVLDAIWPEVEKYQQFVQAVIDLGPDGVEGVIEYLGGGALIPFMGDFDDN